MTRSYHIAKTIAFIWPCLRNTPQVVRAEYDVFSLVLKAVSQDWITYSISGRSSLSHGTHHSARKIPPPFGIGRCCSCPAEAYEPSDRSSLDSVVSSILSGQRSCPSLVLGSVKPSEVWVGVGCPISYRAGKHK